MAGGRLLTEEWFEYTASVEASRDGMDLERLPDLPGSAQENFPFTGACLVALSDDQAMVTGGNYEAGTPFDHAFVYRRGDDFWTRYFKQILKQLNMTRSFDAVFPRCRKE